MKLNKTGMFKEIFLIFSIEILIIWTQDVQCLYFYKKYYQSEEVMYSKL